MWAPYAEVHIGGSPRVEDLPEGADLVWSRFDLVTREAPATSLVDQQELGHVVVAGPGNVAFQGVINHMRELDGGVRNRGFNRGRADRVRFRRRGRILPL